MSTTEYLIAVLPGPIYLSQPITDESLPPHVIQIPGKRHETLAEAREILACHGFDLDQSPVIMATIRNPYDLEVSRWAFLRQRHGWERGPEQELACAHGFAEFAVKNDQRGGNWATDALAYLGQDTINDNAHGRPYPNELKDFFTIAGRTPGNLRIIRFENIVADLRDALRGVGVDSDARFPWVNRSRREPYPTYYTPRAEEGVYERYRWAFDEGFYDRFAPDQANSAATHRRDGHLHLEADHATLTMATDAAASA